MEKGEMTLSKAVCKAIDSYPVGVQFFGRELQKEASRYYPKASKKYPDTILRIARKFRRNSYKCVSASKSLYVKVGE